MDVKLGTCSQVLICRCKIGLKSFLESLLDFLNTIQREEIEKREV